MIMVIVLVMGMGLRMRILIMVIMNGGDMFKSVNWLLSLSFIIV